MSLKYIKDVVDNNYCVGCGACAYLSRSSMELNRYGEYQPELEQHAAGDEVEAACPFLKPELNEDVLANEFFDSQHPKHDGIGTYIQCYGARVCSSEIREAGTSGGVGTWIALALLRQGLIDGVIHAKAVKREDAAAPFFKYAISRSEDAIREGAKTRYHVMEMSGVMEEVRNTPGNYLFIGVPCFSKAVRRLQKLDPVIRERVRYVVSLVCGHYKSVNWTLSLGWSADIDPVDLSAFQYRCKGPGIDARAYVFKAFAKDGRVNQKDSTTVTGGKFNSGAMMLNACDYCDDVVGETADLTIGDAWLSKFAHDPGGTNLLIARSDELHSVLLQGEADKEVELYPISPNEAVRSQSGGFRQRREGLSHRLAKAKQAGRDAPVKRVQPGAIKLSPLRAKIYDLRHECSKLSRELFVEALESNSYEVYEERMSPNFRKLRKLEVVSSFWRAASKRIGTKLQGFYSRVKNQGRDR